MIVKQREEREMSKMIRVSEALSYPVKIGGGGLELFDRYGDILLTAHDDSVDLRPIAHAINYHDRQLDIIQRLYSSDLTFTQTYKLLSEAKALLKEMGVL